LKHIYFTVTNDLNFDQRMHRICGSLSANGYEVTLIGRERKSSIPLLKKPFQQHRIKCVFEKGFFFYAEYNLRLFFYLLNKKMDGICSIDLDTILPGYFISKIKDVPRIYDAHEYFTEMKEVQSRRFVKAFWTKVEKFCVPKFEHGYTVSKGLSIQFKEKYNRDYTTIRNITVLKALQAQPAKQKIILYQGAVNEARGFESLIPAMQQINYPLVVCGDGNFMPQLKTLIRQYKVEDKVVLKGMLTPEELSLITPTATLGVTLSEKEGMHNWHALPNKFFDYMHACVPQVAMNFPEYKAINYQYKVAVLIDDLNIETLAKTINNLMDDERLLKELRDHCIKAREVYNWQQEEKKLVVFYNDIFNNE
jgi:glycosyltransferase involved in cell wall biosynthesis